MMGNQHALWSLPCRGESWQLSKGETAEMHQIFMVNMSKGVRKAFEISSLGKAVNLHSVIFSSQSAEPRIWDGL